MGDVVAPFAKEVPPLPPVDIKAPRDDPPPAPSGFKKYGQLAIRGFDILVSLYTFYAFITTSSLIDVALMRQSVFLDDLANGLYDFKIRDNIDNVILDHLKTTTAATSKYLGYQDHRHTFPTASWCHRLGIDLGCSVHITYYGDHLSRRFMRKAYGTLPGNCTSFTVAEGGNYNDTRMIMLNDARKLHGTSYLHCTDPRLWASQDPKNLGTNSTEFRFRATYLIAQQHHASALFGIETQTSFCKAVKVGDTEHWRVYPATPDDTRAHLTVIFAGKNWVLQLLDFGGQIAISIVLIKEVIRAMTHVAIFVPTSSRTIFRMAVDRLTGNVPEGKFAPINAGISRFKLSNVWLASPWYIIGSAAYAVGSSIESQMIVEVLYWQYGKSKDVHELILAGVYAMRHAWVSVAVWSVARMLVIVQTFPIVPQRVRDHIRTIETYCASRLLVFSFIASSILATFTRGKMYLIDSTDLMDPVGGIEKSTFWKSEVFQSLAVNHAFGLLFGYVLATLNRVYCELSWPRHRTNSFLRAVDRHRIFSGFDVMELLSKCKYHSMGKTEPPVLVLRLSEFYQVYASIKMFTKACVALDLDLKTLDPGTILTLTTSEDGVKIQLMPTDKRLNSPALVDEIRRSIFRGEEVGLIAIQ